MVCDIGGFAASTLEPGFARSMPTVEERLALVEARQAISDVLWRYAAVRSPPSTPPPKGVHPVFTAAATAPAGRAWTRRTGNSGAACSPTA